MRLTVRHVQETVAEHFEVPFRSMSWHGTSGAQPRQVAMFLARRLCVANVRSGNQSDRVSYPALGRIFKRDHSTIIYAERKVENLIRDDSNFAAEINAIAVLLGASQPVDKWHKRTFVQRPQGA